MHALFPGQNIPACRVHLHGVSPGDGEVLAVHTTCYPYEMTDGYYCWDRTPPMHTAVLVPPPRAVFDRWVSSGTAHVTQKEQENYWRDCSRAEVAEIVTVVIYDDAPPALALDSLVRAFPHARAYAVVTDARTCLAAIRVRPWDPDAAPCGYTVTMAAAPDTQVTNAGFYSPPVTLYAALLLGWARWWVLGARDLTDRNVSFEDLPPPPLALDLVEAFQPHRVELKNPELVTWHRPDPPRIHYEPWRDGVS